MKTVIILIIAIIVMMFFTSYLNIFKLMFLFIELGNLFQTEDQYMRDFLSHVVFQKEIVNLRQLFL